MSNPRLTFLYPHVFRNMRNSEAATKTIRIKPSARAPLPSRRDFATSQMQRDRLVERHGKAVEPFLAKGESPESMKLYTPEPEKAGKVIPESEQKTARSEAEVKYEDVSAGALSEELQAALMLPGDLENSTSDKELEEKPTPLQQAAINTADTSAPLDNILHMPPPETQEEEDANKPPHLQAPPYVHHFDTYTLVQQVEAGGFTSEQSVTAMKAVRAILADNLQLAKSGLVSKSGVENESYLFRAACSELKTEVQNQRKANNEKMRRERTILQHEVDILGQKLGQDLLTLRDDLKGMFDDRKMSVRQEQRAAESAIQQLNYKITVDLNSEIKSEVEGVRWLLTRRSVMGILFMAFMVLSSLRYASVQSHSAEIKRKRQAEAAVALDERKFEDVPLSATDILAAN
ncbi:hypothetical protein BJ878DRAFT_558979 [Calycina marina]|uniref:Uncharacterized protein n=1 Tax=Calycina marina TaxID=1763456 RepID=A0A9P7YWK5_9HELO|nr:hypothetical protein BJ878DRAFT_558979 [Calycina marina]